MSTILSYWYFAGQRVNERMWAEISLTLTVLSAGAPCSRWRRASGFGPASVSQRSRCSQSRFFARTRAGRMFDVTVAVDALDYLDRIGLPSLP
jgi:hypothetical protein